MSKVKQPKPIKVKDLDGIFNKTLDNIDICSKQTKVDTITMEVTGQLVIKSILKENNNSEDR